MGPKFSVVIAVFNKEDYVTHTLESVLSQTYTNFEVVIVNDGSTDRSESKILEFKDPRIVYYSESNMGAGGARNYVIEKSNGEYIALLDADDIWDKNYLQEQNNSIEKFPDEKVFATSLNVIKRGKKRVRDYSIKVKPNERIVVDYFSSSMLESILHSSSTVLKKDLFQETGFYNPKIKSGQDTDLYIRIGLKRKVVFYNSPLVSYNIIEGSLFRTTKSVNDKPDFVEYEQYEADNIKLKKFLDINRYSLCILSILEGNSEKYNQLHSKIDTENLTTMQRFLLYQPKSVLKLLYKIKNSSQKIGIRLSTFK